MSKYVVNANGSEISRTLHGSFSPEEFQERKADFHGEYLVSITKDFEFQGTVYRLKERPIEKGSILTCKAIFAKYRRERVVFERTEKGTLERFKHGKKLIRWVANPNPPNKNIGWIVGYNNEFVGGKESVEVPGVGQLIGYEHAVFNAAVRRAEEEDPVMVEDMEKFQKYFMSTFESINRRIIKYLQETTQMPLINLTGETSLRVAESSVALPQ